MVCWPYSLPFFTTTLEEKNNLTVWLDFVTRYNAGNINGTRTATLPYSWVHSRNISGTRTATLPYSWVHSRNISGTKTATLLYISIYSFSLPFLVSLLLVRFKKRLMIVKKVIRSRKSEKNNSTKTREWTQLYGRVAVLVPLILREWTQLYRRVAVFVPLILREWTQLYGREQFLFN
jgi:hypothetical protein